MANDNNKINRLVPESDDDPTSELKSLQDPEENRLQAAGELENESDTFEYERIDGTRELSGKSVAALKSDIKSRNESISRLQFDIEQLRARWTGLEKEISAREELTNKLNSELTDAQASLSRVEKLLGERESYVESLQVELKDKSTRLSSLEKEAISYSETVESGKTIIEELQKRVAEQSSVIKDLKSDDAKKELKAELREKDASLKQYQDDLKAEKSLRESGEREAAQNKRELRQTLEKLENALQENLQLKAPFELEHSTDESAYRQRIEQQNGLLSDNLQELNDYRVQISRTEDYADRLRIQLQEALQASEDSKRRNRQLEAALADADNRILELNEQLENEKLESADLRKQNQQSLAKFEDEIRQMRFDLGNAQDTIGGQDSINEQLASDLIDNQGFRLALESQLESTSKDSRNTIRELKRQVKKLDQSNEELDRKLENKTNAIAALLAELASRSRTIDSIGEIENVIHEIDGRMSDSIDEKSATEKDRMARLLIGNVDGQELRFPLFKDRLTIGRTAHNDIQLRAQFVSRRHAVIVTENEKARIIDWGSKNGVYINDMRIAEQILRNGDVVAVGTAEFRYEERPKR